VGAFPWGGQKVVEFEALGRGGVPERRVVGGVGGDFDGGGLVVVDFAVVGDADCVGFVGAG
jgi:hypothetical protein